ncbi:hypothetical protein VISP3789_21243 [Vibrio splendidus ATCC 33789]|nr:hypothetical protein VISP3789_21243 [Vibrio splendidus ATCC 33789]
MAKFKYQVDKRTKKQPIVALSTFLPRLTKVIHNMLKVTGNPQHLPPSSSDTKQAITVIDICVFIRIVRNNSNAYKAP